LPNGRQAVDLWQSFRPDLIFMDISMPEMDGKEAARAIRTAEGPEAHVPIVTALTARRCLGHGPGDADALAQNCPSDPDTAGGLTGHHMTAT
jgi:CheY-like chemotaxis protein